MIPSHSGGQLGPAQRAKTHLTSGSQHNLCLPPLWAGPGGGKGCHRFPWAAEREKLQGAREGDTSHHSQMGQGPPQLLFVVYMELSGRCWSQCWLHPELHKPQELGVLSPILPQQRGQHSPRCHQLHQGCLIQAQGRDNTFDLLWLGLYVPLTLFLGLHQEIDLLFFGENIIRIDLPRQNPSDNALAPVMAWLCSPNPPQESHVWVALGRFNNTGKNKALPAFLLLFFPLPRLMLTPSYSPLSLWSFLLMVLCRNQCPVGLLPQLPVTHHQQCWVSLLPMLSSPGQVWQALGKVPDQSPAKQPLPSAQSRQCSPWHPQPPHDTTSANECPLGCFGLRCLKEFRARMRTQLWK